MSFTQIKNLQDISEEIQIEYPLVKEISISRGYTRELSQTNNVEKLFVIIKTSKGMSQTQRLKLTEYLKARSKIKI